MKCPNCNNPILSVIDSRTSIDNTIRRRRRCDKCGNRISTREFITKGARSCLEDIEIHVEELQQNINKLLHEIREAKVGSIV